MKVIFIHQNMPGQFKHLAAWFGRHPRHETVFITQRKDRELQGVSRAIYGLHRQPRPETHPYLLRSEAAVLHGQAVARVLVSLRDQKKFVPDLVIGHTGWGETLYVKDVFPDTPLIGYCEFFYKSKGADIGFDPAEQPDLDSLLRSRTRNFHFLSAVDSCDLGWSPTEWQRSTYPREMQSKIRVVHEGIDTALLKPDPQAAVTLPNGRVLTPADEVVTYISRNLEPYRGFHVFMRALPKILAERPNAQVVVVGGDRVSYSNPPKDGGTWREVMLKEVPVDPERVHFLGSIPYGEFRRVLQISSAHVYLTFPFVLSWSMLEAMSSGCLIIGSRTAPVTEVLRDGDNGVLVDFFSHDEVADRVIEALAEPRAFDAIRQRARQTVLEAYDLRHCAEQQLAMISGLVRGITE